MAGIVALTLSQNLSAILSQISAAAAKSARRPEDITLISVTKNVAPEIVQQVLDLGILNIGENRVQEAVEKFAKLPQGLKFTRHMIGHLQKNKVGRALEIFDIIQSVDSVALASEIEKKATAKEREISILLEVNVAEDPSKFGFLPDALPREIHRFAGFPHLQVEGLMTIAPLEKDMEKTRPHFRKLRELSENIQSMNIPRVQMRHLSMGMSDDFPVAIEEGATMIRVGRALFGERT